MKIRYGALFADAAAMWRRSSELLLTLAGVFTFLPVFAVQLFVPMPPANVPDTALFDVLVRWYAQNGLWLGGAMLVQLFGAAATLALLLDPARPTVAEAMRRVTRVAPALLLGGLVSLALAGLGAALFVLPGLYALGRCYLVWAVAVAEPQRAPVEAVAEALKRTRRHGWILTAVMLSVLMPAYVLADIFAAPASASAFTQALSGLLIALLSAAAGIAQMLLQAAAYRALSKGI